MRHTHTDLAKTVIRVILFETCTPVLPENVVLCGDRAVGYVCDCQGKVQHCASSSETKLPWKYAKENYHLGSQLKQ